MEMREYAWSRASTVVMQRRTKSDVTFISDDLKWVVSGHSDESGLMNDPQYACH